MVSDRLKRLASGGGNPALLGERVQRLLAEGKVEEAARLEEAGVALDIVAVVDRTRSMYGTIEEVKAALDGILDELFKGEKETRVGIVAIEDHHGRSGYLGVETFGLSSLREDIKKYIQNLQVASSNTDNVENYECGWLEAVRLLNSASPGARMRKTGIITFMETAAHGQLQDLLREGYFSSEEAVSARGEFDNGCTMGEGNDWRIASNLAKRHADLFFLVDCNGASGAESHFRKAKQYLIKPDSEREVLVPLHNAMKIIPQLVCAMAERTRGVASYVNYVQTLSRQDAPAAEAIQKYLPPPR